MYSIASDIKGNGNPKENRFFKKLYRSSGPGLGWIKFPKWSLAIMTGEQALLFNFLVDRMTGCNDIIFEKNGYRFWCENKLIVEKLNLGIWIVKRLIDELKQLGFIQTANETSRRNNDRQGFRNRRWIVIRFDRVWKRVRPLIGARQSIYGNEDDYS